MKLRRGLFIQRIYNTRCAPTRQSHIGDRKRNGEMARDFCIRLFLRFRFQVPHSNQCSTFATNQKRILFCFHILYKNSERNWQKKDVILETKFIFKLAVRLRVFWWILDKVFDKVFWWICFDEFFWRIFWQIFCRIFSPIIFASFRIGVLLI